MWRNTRGIGSKDVDRSKAEVKSLGVIANQEGIGGGGRCGAIGRALSDQVLNGRRGRTPVRRSLLGLPKG